MKIIKKSGTDSIISQYIGFCKVYNDQSKIYGNSIEAAKETIKYCIEYGFLKDYLMEHSKEVITMMAEIFNVETQCAAYDKASRAEARKEEKRNTALNLLNIGVSVDIIAQGTGLSLDEINKLKESVNTEA